VTAILELVDKISLAISISLTSVDREENDCSVNNGKNVENCKKKVMEISRKLLKFEATKKVMLTLTL
jgi:hypothetical protein